MKDFLENLIKNIVDNPDEVKVEESTDETGRTVLLISVADSDMGRVIGKSGKVINAIRTIARIMAIRQGVRIRVDVKDTDRPMSSEAAPAPEQTPAVAAEEPEEDLVLEDEPEAETAVAEPEADPKAK